MVQQGQDRDSTVSVYVDITVAEGVDLTGQAVNVAFVPRGTRPGDSDWQPASIIAGNTIEILVGNWDNPDGIPIGFASYPTKLDIWVDIIDSPERPKAPVGTWTVT